MISADQVMPLLLDAAPSFEQRWSAELEHDPIHLNDDATRLHYLDAMEFAVHLISLFKARRFDEIEAAFSVIERFHLEGDPYVRELATIGYLESLQNVESADFERFLLPESRRWWNGLTRFWTGQAPAVLPTDD